MSEQGGSCAPSRDAEAKAASPLLMTSSAERSIHLTKALGASVGLSVLFLIVYGWCNWITAQRPDVGTLYFEWERLIPFVPLMIVPYMSIDLFFVAAPFLCRSDRELAAFSKRIVAAIVVAGICFLLFPLRFAFERPAPAAGSARSLIGFGDGPAVQPPPFAPHRVPNDPGPALSPAHPRDSAMRHQILGSSWSASRPSSPTSITSWTWSPALLSASVASTSSVSPCRDYR